MKPKTCFKALMVYGNDIFGSFFAKGTLFKKYVLGETTRPDISCLYAFDTLENAKHFVENNRDYIEKSFEKAVIFECSYKKSKSRFAYYWDLEYQYLSIKSMLANWKKNFELCDTRDIKTYPLGTIACSEITLLKQVF